MFETQGGTRNGTRDLQKKGSAFIVSTDHRTACGLQVGRVPSVQADSAQGAGVCSVDRLLCLGGRLMGIRGRGTLTHSTHTQAVTSAALARRGLSTHAVCCLYEACLKGSLCRWWLGRKLA